MKKVRILLIILSLVVLGFFIVNNKSDKKYVSDIIEIGNPKKLSSYTLVEENDKDIQGTANVKFDAFFVINGQQRRGNSIAVGDNKKLRVILSVEGDAVLTYSQFHFKNSNVNVGFSGTLNNNTINSTKLDHIYILNPIESGRNMDFFINLSDNLSNDITSFKGTNSIVFEADLEENGQTKRIRKEVFYDVDWYLKDGPTAAINDEYTINAKNKDGNLEISYNFGTNVDMDSLLKSVNLDIDLPKLNDLDPISAKIIGTNTTYEADLTNYKLTGKREAVIKDQAIFNSASDYTKNGYSYNSFKVVLEYPTLYESNISIPPLNVNGWYEVYNNPDTDYQDTVVSNIANKILVRANNITNDEYDVSSGYEYPTYINFVTNTSLGIPLSTGGTYVDKTNALNILDGLDGDETTTYDVTIATTVSAVCNAPVEHCAIGKINLNNLTITDNSYDRFNNNTSMKNVLKYKTIRFTNTWMLGDSGYIKLINDETGETIHVFTKDDWLNDYTFETDVRKIKIETSAINNVILNVGDTISALTVYITKEIDNTAIGDNYTRNNFDNFNTINTSTKTTGERIGEVSYNFVDNQGAARYMSYISSRPTLRLSTGTLKTNETTPVKMTINTGDTDGLTKGFKDGIFLIAIPNPIIGVQVTDITTNNSNINIVGYEVEEGDTNIIRVFTSNDFETDFELYIDTILTPDSRSFGTNKNIELYAINNNIKITNNTKADIYDADKDGNTTEKVGYDAKGISLVVPTDVITNTTIKTYTGSHQERSVVSPKITDVNPLEDSSDAKVEIMLMNNSNENIQDVIITGKVGFIGNTYQISGIDMESEYNIPMTSDGITVPESVRDYAKVYYSVNASPSNDLNDANNNWKVKEEVTDFSNVKSFMIVLENYSMNKSNLVFTYDVTLPLDKSLINKTSYFTHGVYYNSVTIDGLVYRELGGAKAGVQMAIKYKLDLNAYKAYSSRKIPNAKYVLTDDNNKSRLLVVNSNGYVREEDLYVERDYQLKQTSVMFPYILDEETKYFRIISDNNDILQLSGSEVGTYKSISITSDLLTIDLENEVRYDLLIKNSDIDTLAAIPGSSFRITGKGYENGREIITNADGELKLHGLYLDHEYVIEQTFAKDSLGLKEPFTIILSRLNGELKMLYKNGNTYRTYATLVDEPHVSNSNIIQNVLDDDSYVAPLYKVEIKTKSIPIYKLEVTKVSADTHEPLSGAQYKITGYGLSNLGAYIKTDVNGKATIDLKEEVDVTANNANTYSTTTIDGFNYAIINGEYTIQEVVPPVGYTIDTNIIKFKVKKLYDSSNCTGNNSTHAFECTTDANTEFTHNLVFTDPNKTFVESTFDMTTNTLKVVLYDYPLVNIIKKDGEDNSLLPNTLFSIYSLSYDDLGNEVLTPATDANGITLGSQITINGQKQYIVATNEHGKINLSLSSGEYKAVEVQASHDKYKLDTRGYYFSVGPTIEYEGGGVVLQDSFNASSFKIGNSDYTTVISTSDGGWILSRCGLSCNTKDIIFEKYDRNHNIQWTAPMPTRLYDRIKVFKYYDDKTKEIRINDYYSTAGIVYPNHAYTQQIIEIDEGYLLQLNYGGNFKLDKEGHLIWRDFDYQRAIITYYTAACNKETGKIVEAPNLEDETGEIPYDIDNPYIQRDDETYYCSTRTIYDDITGYYQPELLETYANRSVSTQTFMSAIDSKGNITTLSGGYLQNDTFLLSDGTIRSFDRNMITDREHCKRRVYDDPDDPNSDYHLEDRDEWCSPSYYDAGDRLKPNKNVNPDGEIVNKIERFDANGNLISANLLNIYFAEAHLWGYLWGYVYPMFRVYTFANDDLLVVGNPGMIRLRYNEEHHDYDLIYGIRHANSSKYSQNKDYRITIEGNGFSEMIYADGKVYNHDENGVVTSVIDPTPEFNIETTGENYLSTIANTTTNGTNVGYYKINEDRYIYFIVDVANNMDNAIIPVYLKSGDTVNVEVGKDSTGNLKNRLIIFETDGESNIKYVRQYNGFQENQTIKWNASVLKPQLSSDGRKMLIPVNALPNSTLYNVDTGKTIVLNGNMLIMEVLDETKPEVPEKYSVEVLNYRKTYNITVDSKENGRAEVVNDNTTVYVVDNTTQVVDTIKYGEDLTYRIKAKGNQDYVVDQVLLNGEPLGYTILEDGSILLDSITDIKEDKNIEITYKFANSYVIVHHYKKGTTERIASDETITGAINAPYQTNPTLSELYQLQRDENGEYILPGNKDGFFASEPLTVIYYYEEGMVNLKVNYYLQNTTIPLVPSQVFYEVLGYNYRVEPINIDDYELVDIIGDETGTLSGTDTVVTYMYQQKQKVNITVKYINKIANEEIIPSSVISVYKLDSYEVPLKTIEGYDIVDKTTNYKGIAEDDSIEVIIYYEPIKEPEEVKGVEEPVKESPKTGDSITTILLIGILSIIGLVISIRYISIKNS